MSLLENYIRGYLLKEQINASDHKLIEDTMEELDRNLKSKTPSMSLDTLSFSPRSIGALRDFRAVKDQGEELTKPRSLNRNFLRKSQSLDKFNMTAGSDFVMPGLGFNPLEKLKSNKTYYTQKIHELIDIYEKADPVKWSNVIETLNNCLNLKQAIDQTGLKVLGAGLYRIVVTIPGLDEIVVKIGLGDKGREDCRKEIDFSDGIGASRLQHQKNFPTIYTRSDNKSWYAIEKAVFFSDKVFSADADASNQATKQEIYSDIEEQFPNTMAFFQAILDEFKLKEINYKINSKWELFQKYLHVLFKKDKSYDEEHEKYASDAASKKPPKLKYLADLTDKTRINLDRFDTSVNSNSLKAMALENVIRKIVESSSPDAIISKNIFKRKLEGIVKDLGFSLTWNQKIIAQKINPIAVQNKIINDHLNDSNIQIMLDEVGSMFDQAVVTDIRDLHIGNMGFKKNDQNKWQLIFTDIDSK